MRRWWCVNWLRRWRCVDGLRRRKRRRTKVGERWRCVGADGRRSVTTDRGQAVPGLDALGLVRLETMFDGDGRDRSSSRSDLYRLHVDHFIGADTVTIGRQAVSSGLNTLQWPINHCQYRLTLRTGVLKHYSVSGHIYKSELSSTTFRY